MRTLQTSLTFLYVFSFRMLEFVAIPAMCFGDMVVQLLLSALWPYAVVVLIIVGLLIHTYTTNKRGEAADEKEITCKRLFFSRCVYAVIVVFYLVLPSVSNGIFVAKKCPSFVTNDDGNLINSYLLADMSMNCDKSTNKEYETLLNLFWILFVLWPVLVPIVLFNLLWSIRGVVRSGHVTMLSEACRFLWQDYNENMVLWELVDIMREISLTVSLSMIALVIVCQTFFRRAQDGE